MNMTETEIFLDHLRRGNRGAQSYFMERVNLMLLAGSSADAKLVAFLKPLWPVFQEGLANNRDNHGNERPAIW
jgi:hypothetical protein